MVKQIANTQRTTSLLVINTIALVLGATVILIPKALADASAGDSNSDHSVLSSSKKYDAAELNAVFVKAATEVKSSPMSPQSHIKFGEALQLRGDFFQAEKEYKLAIQLSQGRQNPTAQKRLNALGAEQKSFTLEKYVRLGAERQREKNYQAAEDAYKRALQIDIRNSMNWSKLGSVYKDMGQDINASRCYEQSLKWDAGNEAAKEGLYETSRH